ncbi:MAG: sarcosine oxidase subunit delta [Paracoccaceae bacterium]
MRITCPHCGTRDRREFTYRGHATFVDRPEGDWGPEWDAHLHLRENPAGWTYELWMHDPCGTWFVCARNTVTNEMGESIPVIDPASAKAAFDADADSGVTA